MEQIVLVVHLAVSLAIIGLIMIQQGKGADMGASFGAGASQTLFGSGGSGNVLSRTTAWVVAIFFATSFGLAVIATQQAAPVDDLGLSIPEQQAQVPAADELSVPAATDNDIPAVEGSPVQEAAGTGNGDLPVVEDDIPVATPE